MRATRLWPELTTAYLGLRSLSYPKRLVFRDGLHLELQDFYDLTTFWPIFFTPIYPIRSSDEVIIDAGANVGMFTLYAATHAAKARIISIEPSPPTFSRLETVVAQNHIGERIELVNVALGAEPGTATMQGEDVPSQFRHVSREGSGSTVKVETLANLIAERRLERVDLLKMDIEGGEYQSLLCTGVETLRRCRRIALEYHPGEDERARLFDRLTAAGFTRTSFADHGDGYGHAHFELGA